MAKFAGTLWLANDTSTRLSVEVDIDDGGLVVVTSGERDIGKWSRSSLLAEPSGPGFRLRAEGEELVFMSDTPGFGEALASVPVSGATPTLKPTTWVGTAAAIVATFAILLTLVAERPLAGIGGGILGGVLGLIANRGLEWWEAPRVKALAAAAGALGIIAVTLGVMDLDLLA